MKAPFPWFGGKSQAAPLIWERLGEVTNYVEPFFGSGAVLLGNPAGAARVETVNDIDGMIANVWRAIAAEPDAVAEHASYPVNEVDLHARHLWLVERLRGGFAEWLMGDPDHYDAKVAGWWLWGMAAWIGGGYTSGKGPWGRDEDGKLAKVEGGGVARQLPPLNDNGKGVNAPRIQRKLPEMHDDGRGVNRADLGAGRRSPGLISPGLVEWMHQLQERMRWVRVTCGDWRRVTGPSVTYKNLSIGEKGICGVVLDPPYHSSAGRTANLYTHDCENVAADVTAWAIEHGDNPRTRIAVCGFEGDCNDALAGHGWTPAECFKGSRAGYFAGGYGQQSAAGTQMHRDRVWFSPHCLAAVEEPQMEMFG